MGTDYVTRDQLAGVVQVIDQRMAEAVQVMDHRLAEVLQVMERRMATFERGLNRGLLVLGTGQVLTLALTILILYRLGR